MKYIIFFIIYSYANLTISLKPLEISIANSKTIGIDIATYGVTF